MKKLTETITVLLSVCALSLFNASCDKGHDHDDHDHDKGEEHAEGDGDKKSASAGTADNYPLKVCVVSGEEFGGEMGEPFVYNHNGTIVKFCCEPCVDDFKKEPEKFLAKLTAAAKAE